MNEHDPVISLVRESFSGLRMDTPVETILAGRRVSRVRRVRRLRRLSGLAAAGAAGAAVAITLTAGGPPPARSAGPPPRPVAAKLVAFTVTGGPGGSTTLILHKGPRYQRLDPRALRQALARHGIPALVTVGTFCRSMPSPPTSSGEVVHASDQADGSALMINGRALPPGTRLSIGYFRNAVRMLLIKDGARLLCGAPSHQPAAHLVSPGHRIRGRR